MERRLLLWAQGKIMTSISSNKENPINVLVLSCLVLPLFYLMSMWRELVLNYCTIVHPYFYVNTCFLLAIFSHLKNCSPATVQYIQPVCCCHYGQGAIHLAPLCCQASYCLCVVQLPHATLHALRRQGQQGNHTAFHLAPLCCQAINILCVVANRLWEAWSNLLYSALLCCQANYSPCVVATLLCGALGNPSLPPLFSI